VIAQPIDRPLGRSPWRSLIGCLLILACACSSRSQFLEKDLIGPSVGDEIVVAGQRFKTGTPVVLWTDPGSYDAYLRDYHFSKPLGRKGAPKADEPRLTLGRATRDPAEVLVHAYSNDLTRLKSVVDQFVLHYDACGYSARCFRVLHDLRGLSVHFMLDIDGTIYQTMDVVDQAWHAAKANPRSIGIEIANIGARPPASVEEIDRWYRRDAEGLRIQLPEEAGRAGVRKGEFVGRPARIGRQRGLVQGMPFEMYDFTPEQYDALVKLTATLCQVFPQIEPDAPRDAGSG